MANRLKMPLNQLQTPNFGPNLRKNHRTCTGKRVLQLALLYFFFLPLFLYADLKSDLNSDLCHIPPVSLEVDAVFALKFHRAGNLDRIVEQFQSYGIAVNAYQKFIFPGLPQNLVDKYCSPNVSPYLLAEILSHLSIYEYCLKKELQKVLIVNSHAVIEYPPDALNSLLKELEAIDPSWDIFYTDIDYHHQETGEFIAPQIVQNGQLQPNKQQISPHISKLFCRYGAVSYLISRLGMQKILNALNRTWYDLPYDQAIFKIPRLRCYTAHFDLITNSYAREIQNFLPFAEEKMEGERSVGEEFWIDPIELLTPNRFDVIAKYIYAKYHLQQYETQWHIDLYKDHIGKQNNFYEGAPLKIGSDAFQKAFHNLLEDLKTHGYSPYSEPVPVNSRGNLLNGSHRVGACLALKIPVKAKVVSRTSFFKNSSFDLRKRHGVQERFLDSMALEYAKLKKDTYIVCLFPSGYSYLEQAEKLLSDYGTIVYSKDLLFSSEGTLELIRLLYLDESWVGTQANNFRQGRVKAELCFPQHLLGKYPLRVYLYECRGIKEVKEIKERIRDLVRIGNDSIHINDRHDQTVLLASALFNENSVRFMNQRHQMLLPVFDALFFSLRSCIQEGKLDSNTFCIDSGAVLSAYGLRDCMDIDLLHKNPLPPLREGICSHNSYLKYHTKVLDDILFNPCSHFFYQGVKFLHIDLLKTMKKKRAEMKDRYDLVLIESIDL